MYILKALRSPPCGKLFSLWSSKPVGLDALVFWSGNTGGAPEPHAKDKHSVYSFRTPPSQLGLSPGVPAKSVLPLPPSSLDR